LVIVIPLGYCSLLWVSGIKAKSFNLIWTHQKSNHQTLFLYSDTSYLPCGFAYISRHSHHTLFKVFSLAAIVHSGYFHHNACFQAFKSYDTLHIVFLHFLRLPATFSLGYVSRHIQPAFQRYFCWIRFIYCRLDCQLT